MAEPITTAIATVVATQLVPPILRESIRYDQERAFEKASGVSKACEILNAPEVVKKVIIGATVVTRFHPFSIALSVVGGVVRGVDRYSKS
jgi:hypothetical protein